MFYSDCFFEYLKAKIKNNKIKVIYISPFKNEVFYPHWMWIDNDNLYDFYTPNKLYFWQYIWHKGEIRIQNKEKVFKYMR